MAWEIAFPEAWSAKQREIAERTLANFERLIADAKLLVAHGRFKSAFSLSVLALEEVGKVALSLWDNPEELRAYDRKWTFHRKKQTAATMLLQAEHGVLEAIRLLKTRDPNAELPQPQEGRAIREALAEAIASSKASRLAFYVALGATERVKHLGFYFDEDSYDLGLTGDDLTREAVMESIMEAEQSASLLSNRMVIAAARNLYLLSEIPKPPPDWRRRPEDRPDAG